MTAYHTYFLTSLDLHLVELEDFKYGGTNITAFRLVDPGQRGVQERKHCNVTILEGAEVRIGFYGRGGRILRGDTSEGAEGPEGWPRG